MSSYTVTKRCHHYHLMSSYTSIHNIDWYFLSLLLNPLNEFLNCQYSFWSLKFALFIHVHSVELLMKMENFQSCDLFINNSRPFNNNNKAKFSQSARSKIKQYIVIIFFLFKEFLFQHFSLQNVEFHIYKFRSKVEAFRMGCSLSRINTTVLWRMESDPQNVIIHWNDLGFWTTSYEILLVFFFDCRFLRMENWMNQDGE